MPLLLPFPDEKSACDCWSRGSPAVLWDVTWVAGRWCQRGSTQRPGHSFNTTFWLHPYLALTFTPLYTLLQWVGSLLEANVYHPLTPFESGFCLHQPFISVITSLRNIRAGSLEPLRHAASPSNSWFSRKNTLHQLGVHLTASNGVSSTVSSIYCLLNRGELFGAGLAVQQHHQGPRPFQTCSVYWRFVLMLVGY